MSRFRIPGSLVIAGAAWLQIAGVAQAEPQTAVAPTTDALRIGSRLEPFLDHYLIDRMEGASLKLGVPQPAEIAITFDRPWEGVAVGYVTVIQDGGTYRMYYRGLPDSDVPDGTDLETTCYAESRDGVTWTRPNVGLFEVNGTRENNVILARQAPSSHNFSPFLDTAPGVAPEQRFKALALGKSGLLAFTSADGIHWKRMRDEPVLTSKDFAFDSQNVAFYSALENCYVCYFRTWKNNVRWISRSTSKDFLSWAPSAAMSYGDTPPEHLYTNQTHPYFRAPHIYIATAARFMQGRRVLSDAELRDNSIPPGWLKDDCSEVVLLTSRGGTRYDRTFMEAFVRPGPGVRNWVSRSNYPALNVVPTGPEEMSFYIQRENGLANHHLRRYTLRLDGFASVNGPYRGGEMITRPVIFDAPTDAGSGVQLVLNFATSAAGGIRCELQDRDGRPVKGYSLEECDELIGDRIARAVTWRGRADVKSIARTPVRLRFQLKDADLYSMRFAPTPP